MMCCILSARFSELVTSTIRSDDKQDDTGAQATTADRCNFLVDVLSKKRTECRCVFGPTYHIRTHRNITHLGAVKLQSLLCNTLLFDVLYRVGLSKIPVQNFALVI